MRRLGIFTALLALGFFSQCGSRGGTSGKLKPSYLDKIVLSQMEFVNNSGQPWDNDGSGPDIRIGLYHPETQVEEFITTTFFNVKAADLPKEWSISAKRLQMFDKNWRLVLYDQDDEIRQVMHAWDFTPSLEDNTITLEGRDNTVYKVLLEFKR